jgi:transcriptional regulator with XRE-family HTH domain
MTSLALSGFNMTKKPAAPIADLTPKYMTKAEFGRHLRQLILKKGWTQSELARRAGLPRDSISTYVRGAVYPSQTSLVKVATALGLDPEQVLPNVIEGSITRSANPSFEMKASETEPGRVWLRVDRAVSFSTAAKIAQLLDEDEGVGPRRAAN